MLLEKCKREVWCGLLFFKMWMYVSGAEDKMKRNPDLYKQLLSAEHDADLTQTIELGKYHSK